MVSVWVAFPIGRPRRMEAGGQTEEGTQAPAD